MVNDLSTSVLAFYGLVFLLSYFAVYRLSRSHVLAVLSLVAVVTLLLTLQIQLSMAVIFAGLSILFSWLVFGKRRSLQSKQVANQVSSQVIKRGSQGASKKAFKATSNPSAKRPAKRFWFSKKLAPKKLNDYIRILQNEIAQRENAIPANEREPHIYSDYSYAELKSELAALQAQKPNNKRAKPLSSVDLQVEHTIAATAFKLQESPNNPPENPSANLPGDSVKESVAESAEGLVKTSTNSSAENSSETSIGSPSEPIPQQAFKPEPEQAAEHESEQRHAPALDKSPEKPSIKTANTVDSDAHKEGEAVEALRSANQQIEKQQWLEHLIERRQKKAIDIDKQTLLQMSIEQLKKFAADLDKLDKLRDSCPQLIPYSFQLTPFANQTLAVRYGIANIEANTQASRFVEKVQAKIRLQKVRDLGQDQYVVFLPDFGQQHALIKHVKGSEVIEEFLPQDATWAKKNADLEKLLTNASALRLTVLAEHFHKKRLQNG